MTRSLCFLFMCVCVWGGQSWNVLSDSTLQRRKNGHNLCFYLFFKSKYLKTQAILCKISKMYVKLLFLVRFFLNFIRCILKIRKNCHKREKICIKSNLMNHVSGCQDIFTRKRQKYNCCTILRLLFIQLFFFFTQCLCPKVLTQAVCQKAKKYPPPKKHTTLCIHQNITNQMK